MKPSSPLKTFIIYARDDESHKKQLLLHLKPLINSGLLDVWHDGNIIPGEDWEKAIKKELKKSELVIMLVSVNALNSDFIQSTELRTALDQLEAGFTRIVPVVVSPCAWRFDPIVRRLQALPLVENEGIRPVSEWPNSHLAWASLVEQIGNMAYEVQESRAEAERLVAREMEEAARQQAEPAVEDRRPEEIKKQKAAQAQRRTPAAESGPERPKLNDTVERSSKLTTDGHELVRSTQNIFPVFSTVRKYRWSIGALAVTGLILWLLTIWMKEDRAPGLYLNKTVLDGALVQTIDLDYIPTSDQRGKDSTFRALTGRCFRSPDGNREIAKGARITEAHVGRCAGVYAGVDLEEGTQIEASVLDVEPQRPGSPQADFTDFGAQLHQMGLCVKCGLSLKKGEKLTQAVIQRCGGVYLKKAVLPGTIITEELVEEVPRVCAKAQNFVVYSKKDILGEPLSRRSAKPLPAGKLLNYATDF